MPSSTWTQQDIPDLTGKRVIVTGATSGVGFETARLLAQHHASVILAVRNIDKGKAAAGLISVASPYTEPEVMALDLSDLASVRQFASEVQARYPTLDVVINNAGVMAPPFTRTADGFEMTFGTNHLGHFALTGLLLPMLLAAPRAHIVTLASEGHRDAALRFDNLNAERGYNKWKAYSNSKFANLIFAYELQRRLAAANASAISIAAHPGFSITPMQVTGPRMAGDRIGEWFLTLSGRLMGQPAEMGALASIYAAVSPDLRGGEYVGPTGFMNLRGYPGVGRSSRASQDREVARRLWEVSEQLTGVRYAFGEQVHVSFAT